MGYPTQNHHSGLKPCDASLKVGPGLLSSSNLKDLSIEDYERALADSEWQAILGTIRSSYQRVLSALPSKSETGFLLCPTPTSSSANGKPYRPAGGDKLTNWFRKCGLLTNSHVLNAQIVELLQGFPLNSTALVLESLDAAQAHICEDESSSAEQLYPNKQRSLSREFCTCNHSPTEKVLGEKQQSKLKQRISVERCDLGWAQNLVEKQHYLHRKVHPRAHPFAYTIALDDQVVGCIIMATPHFTKLKGLFGYEGLPTKWQVLLIARFWLTGEVQAHQSNSHASNVASCAIAQLLKRVQRDWLEHHPPRFPDQPYQIRLILAYADINAGHKGTIYKATNFECWGETNNGRPRHSTRGHTEGTTKLLYVYQLSETQNRSLSSESSTSVSVNNYSLVLGEKNRAHPLELEQGQQQLPVLGESHPLELKEHYEQLPPVLGDEQLPSPLELAHVGESGRTASGWLEHYTKNKQLKSGAIATYPRLEGERDQDNLEHWFWAYRWEEKKESAKPDNGYITRAVSLPKNKVEAVRLAIACGWSVAKILQFIKGEL